MLVEIAVFSSTHMAATHIKYRRNNSVVCTVADVFLRDGTHKLILVGKPKVKAGIKESTKSNESKKDNTR